MPDRFPPAVATEELISEEKLKKKLINDTKVLNYENIEKFAKENHIELDVALKVIGISPEVFKNNIKKMNPEDVEEELDSIMEELEAL